MPDDQNDAAQDFTITPTVRDGVQVLLLEGEVDFSNADELTAALAEALDEVPLVVDLSNLAFIDSSGLHCLLQAAQTGRPAAVVYASASNVGRVLNLIEAGTAVPLYEDIPTALQAINARRSSS